MVCHLKSVSLISMNLGFIEINMAFLRKRKRNCIAIMLFRGTDHYNSTTRSDVHHYANSCDNDVMMLYPLDDCLWQDDFFFADCELHLYPSQGSATIGDNAPPCLHSQ